MTDGPHPLARVVWLVVGIVLMLIILSQQRSARNGTLWVPFPGRESLFPEGFGCIVTIIGIIALVYTIIIFH